jgi:(E)-4-hydroxy-3-methylbut-2-enyl-diphosphate synthase
MTGKIKMPLVQKRRVTRQISIGNVKIGSNAPICVQSMTNTQTQDVKATTRQILALEKAGCEIIRVAVTGWPWHLQGQVQML